MSMHMWNAEGSNRRLFEGWQGEILRLYADSKSTQGHFWSTLWQTNCRRFCGFRSQSGESVAMPVRLRDGKGHSQIKPHSNQPEQPNALLRLSESTGPEVEANHPRRNQTRWGEIKRIPLLAGHYGAVLQPEQHPLQELWRKGSSLLRQVATRLSCLFGGRWASAGYGFVY